MQTHVVATTRVGVHTPFRIAVNRFRKKSLPVSRFGCHRAVNTDGRREPDDGQRLRRMAERMRQMAESYAAGDPAMP
jgi:hypothetical protein